MQLTLGHPARWVDVAQAVAVCHDQWFVLVEWKVEVDQVVNEEPTVLLWVYVRPSVYSPHAGKEPVVRHQRFIVGRDRGMPDQMYRVLWEAMCTVELIWPIGRISKGPTQSRQSVT